MASIKDRLLALEAMRPIQDETETARHIEHAEYMARVLIGFLDRADPAGGMIRRGIHEEEARRFSEMGFHAAQRELMAKLHELVESALH